MARKKIAAVLIPERWVEVQDRPLLAGSHSPDGEMCVMEMAAYVAGEPWSDHPECVSRVITSFMVSWNDSLADEPRQRLKDKIPLVIGTRTTEADETRRSWLATDWLVRTFAPAWLDLAKLTESAAALRELPELSSAELATAAMPIINEAKKNSAAARDAAGDAARDAAWAAAGAAARDAAGDAAWDAAWAAAWAAARDTLAPTVLALQESALDLIDRMAAVGRAS